MNNNLQLAIAIAAAFLGTAPDARAAVLGEVAALSAIGESFRAEIRLSGGKPPDAECFRVVPASGGDFPSLRQGRIAVDGQSENARLVVRDTTRIGEPVLKLVIENVCESRLRREYTLLMPFKPSAQRPSTASPPVVSRAAAVRQTRPAASARPKQEPPPKRPARVLSMNGGDSLVTLAESLYPDDHPAQARFIEATTAANPKLFTNSTTLTHILPAGTTLRMPDLRTTQSVPEARGPETLPPRTFSPSEDRLVVDKALATRSGNTTAQAATNDSGAQSHADRERALSAAIDRSIINELELLARIKELEEIQATLKERILRMQTPPTRTHNPAVAAPAVTPPPAPPATVTVEQTEVRTVAPKNTGSWGKDAYLFGVLGLAALAIVAVLRRSRRPMPQTASSPPAKTHAIVATPDSIEHSKGHTRTEEIDFSVGTTPLQLDWPAGTETEPAIVEEHKSAVELADIMMSFGRVHGAAETLSEFIRGNPREAVTPWLKLLEAYRAAGLRDQFDAIAAELNKTFNVTTVTWQSYDALRASRMSLEDLPHIRKNLEQTWRTTACQQYLQHLLRDNRNGTRAGFPFSVIDEILTLAAILEEDLGPCPPEEVATTPG